MSQKVSQGLLVVEAVVIALPISVFAIFATVIYVNDARRVTEFSLHDWLAVLSILSLTAIFSGWRLYFVYRWRGKVALRQQHVGWWMLIVVGMLVLLASLISALLPSSPEYSVWWELRLDLNVLLFASPIVVPLSHLAYEAFLRKDNLINPAQTGG